MKNRLIKDNEIKESLKLLKVQLKDVYCFDNKIFVVLKDKKTSYGTFHILVAKEPKDCIIFFRECMNYAELLSFRNIIKRIRVLFWNVLGCN